MATSKISALTAISDAAITATDVVPVVDDIGGTPTTFRLSLGQLRTAVLTAPNAGGWATSDYLAAGAGTIPTTGILRVGQGTLTTAPAPLINSTATWNDAAVTFTHQLINVTDTASNAASLLADWQVGGSSKWKVTKAGAVTQAGALTVSAGGLAVTGNSTITGTLGGLTGLTVASGTTAVQALTATTVTTSGAVIVNGAAGTYREVQFRTAGALRWDVLADPTAESGSNAGSDFAIFRYDDAGSSLGAALRITRSSGAVSLAAGLTTGAGITVNTGGMQINLGGINVASGGISVSGNSTITGTLSGITTLTATSFVGALTGNVTGNVSGSSGSTTGNAATATALQTARTINGTAFDGTANITVTAAAGTLTGATLNSSVTASSLTSVGVLAAPHMTSPVVDSGGLTVTAGNVNASSSRVMSGNLEVWNTWDGANTAGVLKLTSDTAATATAGAAALPAAPVGFLKWRIGSTAVLLPYYNL